MGSDESPERKTKHRNPTLTDIAHARYKLLKGRLRTKEILPVHEYLDMEMVQTLQIHNEYLLKILRLFDGQHKT